MSARTRIISLTAVFVLGIVVLIFGIVHLSSRREPSYQGKTLSEWIVPFCRQTTNGLDAPGGPQYFEQLQPTRHAVSQIGTNGLPFLIARLNHRESAFHRDLRQLTDKQPVTALRLADPRVVKVRAIRALAILGPRAQPAIPSLTTQLADPVLSEHAVYALSGMGAEGMRALVDHFPNAAPTARIQIAMTLVSPTSMYRGENVKYWEMNQVPADIVVEGLSRIAQDSSSPFRIPAIQRLGTFGPAASNSVPALLKIIEEKSPIMPQITIRALGEIKSRPDLVVPALSNLLNDPNPGTRMAASSALRGFGYNVQFQPQPPDRSGIPSPPYPRGTTNFVRPTAPGQTSPH